MQHTTNEHSNNVAIPIFKEAPPQGAEIKKQAPRGLYEFLEDSASQCINEYIMDITCQLNETRTSSTCKNFTQDKQK
ncbi:hypothetical protein [Methylobacillus methanolivorans]